MNGLNVLIEQNLDMMEVTDSVVRDRQVDYGQRQSDLNDAESESVNAVLRLNITVQTKTDTRVSRVTQAVSRHENEKSQTFMRLEPSEYWSKVSAPVLFEWDKDAYLQILIPKPFKMHCHPIPVQLKLTRQSSFQESETDRFRSMRS